MFVAGRTQLRQLQLTGALHQRSHWVSVTVIDTARNICGVPSSTESRGSGTSRSRLVTRGRSGASRSSARTASTARREPPSTTAARPPTSGTSTPARAQPAESARVEPCPLGQQPPRGALRRRREGTPTLGLSAPREPLLGPAAGGRSALHVPGAHLRALEPGAGEHARRVPTEP